MTRRPRAIRPLRLVFALLLAGSALPAPVLAQSSSDSLAELRLRKVEAEVSALQRKVFPGGDPQFFAPELQPGQSSATPAPGTPATTAVSDILTRMDSLEAQVARLTAANEENTVRISRIETRLGIGAASPAAATPAAAIPAPATTAPTPTNLVPAPAPAKPEAAAGPSAQRLAAVKAIAKPKTDDPGDDEYSYGYRLWDAKFYPEAEQQLKMFLEKYPKHDRASYARNLLGRALLDQGKPRDAAAWFLQNYQANKKGDRAPDSLLYLAESMKRLKDTTRACVALAQFRDDYPAEAAARLKAQLAETARGLTCN